MKETFDVILTTVTDWERRSDLGMRLKFPDQVVTTLLRSDMVLSSLSSRQEILPELTAPWENQVEKANERKRSKYHELVHCEPTEMECGGFALTVSTVYWEYWVTKRKAVKSGNP